MSSLFQYLRFLDYDLEFEHVILMKANGLSLATQGDLDGGFRRFDLIKPVIAVERKLGRECATPVSVALGKS